jgi:hypothetical protein
MTKIIGLSKVNTPRKDTRNNNTILIMKYDIRILAVMFSTTYFVPNSLRLSSVHRLVSMRWNQGITLPYLDEGKYAKRFRNLHFHALFNVLHMWSSFGETCGGNLTLYP